MLGALVNGLTWLEKRPVGDTAIRDTLGNTVPKTALTRSKAERVDVAISQVGNTVAFVGGGLSVDLLLRKAFQKFQPEEAKGLSTVAQKVQQEGTKELTTAARWAVMSRSIGIYSAMMSSMWAMPFIRNYITTKRTGMVNYADVIRAGGAPRGPQTPEQKAVVEASLKDSKKKALTILGGGAVGILLPMALGYRAASKEWAVKGIKNLFEYDVPLIGGKFKDRFLLEGGKFEKLGGIPSMAFWGIPAYIGWYHASRDPYEKKEVFVRCANFIACFSLPPLLAKKAFAGKFKQFAGLGEKISFDAIKNSSLPEDMAKKAKKLLVGQNLLGMGSSIVLLGVTPQLLNIYLTNRRMAQEPAQKGVPAVEKPAVPAPTVANPMPTMVPASPAPQQMPFQPQFRQPMVWPAASYGNTSLFR